MVANDLMFRGIDMAGNAIDIDLTIITDHQPPMGHIEGSMTLDNPLTLTTDEETYISNQEIVNETTSIPAIIISNDNDHIFTFARNGLMYNGPYSLIVNVSDVFGNENSMIGTFNYEVEAFDFDLIEPSYGWTATELFDVELETNRPGTCKWSLDPFNNYDNVPEDRVMGTSDGFHHSRQFNYSDIYRNGHAYMFFMCRDSYGDYTPKDGSRRYEFILNNDVPQILNAVADPEVIVSETYFPETDEWKLMTTFVVDTDIPTICKYSETETEYENMEGVFPSHGTTNKVNVTGFPIPLGSEDYTYHIACESLSGILGETGEIDFTVNPSQAVSVFVISPKHLLTTTANGIELDVQTNRQASCEYSYDGTSWVAFGNLGTSHVTILTVANEEGWRTVYVRCEAENYGESTAEGSYGLDLNPPTINDVVVPDEVYDSGSITIESIDAQDTMSPIDTYQYQLFNSEGELIQDWTNFHSSRNIYIGGLNLQDGESYYFNIRANDTIFPSWSNEFQTDNIYVNLSLQIELVEPSYGWTSEKTFDIVLETNRWGECKYQLTPFRNYDSLPETAIIPSSDGKRHTLSGYNMDESGDHIYVICKDSDGVQSPTQDTGAKLFKFIYDPVPPTFTISADPNPVVEEMNLGNGTWGLVSVVTAEADKPSFCRMSETATDYDNMDIEFMNWPWMQKVNSLDMHYGGFAKDYTYNVMCRSFADVDSALQTYTITVDPTMGLAITLYSPNNLEIGNATNEVYLNFSINRAADCIYKMNTSATYGTISGPGFAGLSVLLGTNFAEGKYAVDVNCSNLEGEAYKRGEFTVDLSPPIITDVDVPPVMCRTDEIYIKEIYAEETLSEIEGYEWKLMKGSDVIINWTYTDDSEDIEIDEYENGSDLDLEEGLYNFVVRAENSITPLWSNEFMTDSINVNPLHINCTWTGNGTNGTDPCADGDCPALLCQNNITDPDNGETDVDCGGPYCDPCTDGANCSLDSDCASGYYCSESTGTCIEETCFDYILNQDESDMDCGGVCAREYDMACNNSMNCNYDDDCLSNNCDPVTFTCQDASCSDGRMNGDETDSDCGGSCDGCEEGQMCNDASDCLTDLCENGYCTIDMEKDTDGDGMPDWWEIKYGLDPNDPSDARGDLDDDGLPNGDEFMHETNPLKGDTDADGYSDKKEINKGTDPLDRSDFPKSRNIWPIILLILLILVLLGGGGYVSYYYFYATPGRLPWPFEPKLVPPSGTKSKSNLKFFGPKGMLRNPKRMFMAKPKPKPVSVFKQNEMKKVQQRSKIFDAFSSDKKKVPVKEGDKIPVVEKEEKFKMPKTKSPGLGWIDLTKKKENPMDPFKRLSKLNKKRMEDTSKKLSQLIDEEKPEIKIEGERKTLKEKVGKKGLGIREKLGPIEKDDKDVFSKLKKINKGKKK